MGHNRRPATTVPATLVVLAEVWAVVHDDGVSGTRKQGAGSREMFVFSLICVFIPPCLILKDQVVQ